MLAALLYYLLENPKKILGMVLNNTDEELVVKRWNTGGDLHMEHGRMVSFMEDAEGLQAEPVQIRKRYMVDPAKTSNPMFALMFALMFAVPYMADNGTNIGTLTGHPSDLSKLFRTMYDNRRVRDGPTEN